MWHQGFNHNCMKQQIYFFCAKKTTNRNKLTRDGHSTSECQLLLQYASIVVLTWMHAENDTEPGVCNMTIFDHGWWSWKNVSKICFWRNIVVSCYDAHSISCSSGAAISTYWTTPHTFSVNSVVVTLMGHYTYSQLQKYIICMCFKVLPVKRFIHALFWRARFLSLYTWCARTTKPV